MIAQKYHFSHKIELKKKMMEAMGISNLSWRTIVVFPHLRRAYEFGKH
jgi:hypothetical protein